MKALQDFGDIAKKQLVAFIQQNQLAEQQRLFALEQSRAAIERDSVSTLCEIFLLQKEVDTTILAAHHEADSNLTSNEKNWKRKAFQTNLELSDLLDQKIKSKMLVTLSAAEVETPTNRENPVK